MGTQYWGILYYFENWFIKKSCFFVSTQKTNSNCYFGGIKWVRHDDFLHFVLFSI
jgi:hypothetical protein